MTLPNVNGEVPIRTLAKGDGFGLLLDAVGPARVRPGCVVHVGSGSATVQLLEKVAREIRLQDGKVIPIQSVVGMQHWCLDTMVIPDGSRHDVSQYENQISIEGASIMAKEKAAKKAPKAKKEKVAKVYVVTKYDVTAKASTDKGKELAGKESHNGTILAAILKNKAPMTLAEIMDVLPPKKFGTESKNPETIYRWHVQDLIKKGFLKSVDEKVEATSAAEARQGDASEPVGAAASA